MQKCFLILVILLSTQIVLAQTKNRASINGSVIDSQSNIPLVGATIIIEGSSLAVIADNKGEFTIENITRGEKLTVSYMGYKNSYIVIDSSMTTPLVVKLNPESIQIDEVVITAKKDEAREIKQHSMPATVISMQNLSGTVSDISDVIKRVAGVTIRTSGGLGSSARVSVRGLEGKRIGFFIDELPMNDNSDFIGINDIPVEVIDRIEIYKGVVPAKFGGSSVGGAVNIVLLDFPSKYLDANYTYGSFNTHKSSLVVKRSTEDKGYELGVGGFYDYSDNDYKMESPFDEGLSIVRDHDKYSKFSGAIAVTSRKWWFDEVKPELVYIRTTQEIQGVETNIQHAHTYSNAGMSAVSLIKDNFFLDGLDLDMFISGAYTDYNFIDSASYRTNWDGTTYPAVSKYGGETNKWASTLNNKKLTFTNKTNVEYFVDNNHSLNLNSIFTSTKGDPSDELKKKTLGYETSFESDMSSWIVGLSYDYRDNQNKFLNSINVKYYQYSMSTTLTSVATPVPEDVDISEQDYGVVNAMRYRFTPLFMTKFSVGYDVRLPSESELLGDGYIIAPAGSLLPERNTSINLGFLYDRSGRSKDNLQIEVSGYYMHLKDMIRMTGGFLQSQYQNFGMMQTFGVEAEVKADITNYLYGYINATYQDIRDARKYEENSTNVNLTKGERMPNIPYLMSNAGLEFHKENLWGGRGMNTRISADCSFIGEYYYDFEFSELQDRKIPTSLSFDLGVEQSFDNGRYFVVATLFNITDEKILSEFNRPLPGRHFNMRLRYVFK